MRKIIIWIAFISFINTNYAQSLQGPLSDQEIRQSAIIVIGVAGDDRWVIEPEKKDRMENGRVIFRSPREYVTGHLVHFRISEILKNNKRIKLNGTIDIFFPGWGMTDTPYMIEKQKYLVVLSGLIDPDGEFKKNVVLKPGTNPEERSLFQWEICYSIVGGTKGLWDAIPENQKSIDKMRTRVKELSEK